MPRCRVVKFLNARCKLEIKVMCIGWTTFGAVGRGLLAVGENNLCSYEITLTTGTLRS